MFNRAALPAVAYRIGEYAHWRESLVAGLSQNAFRPLTGLLTRDAADFTIGLIDAFACSADVVSFYQERIAHENWLRTATDRVSLQEQGRLIGYRLRPGVAAETWLAFAVEAQPQPPAALKAEPGAFVTGVPAVVPLPAGLRVNSVPGPGEQPQAFETDAALEARAAWNAMPALPDEDRPPGFGAVQTWLAGTATNLRPGDVLVFVGPEFAADANSDRWDRRVLTAVEPDDAGQRTRVAWQEPLGSVSPFNLPPTAPQVYALRERAAVFGHNAPQWSAMSHEFKLAYLGLPPDGTLDDDQLAEWEDFVIWAPGTSSPGSFTAATLATQASQQLLQGLFSSDDAPAAAQASLAAWTAVENAPLLSLAGARRVGLDREYAGIVAGSLALLDKGSYAELYKVTAVTHGARAQFALAGKSTVITLSGENATLFESAVRETAIFARSELLARARTPLSTPVEGSLIAVAADVSALQPGRALLVKGTRVSDGSALVHAATLVAATSAALAADGGTLEIDPPLPEPLRRAGTVVHANVVSASHGETVTQVLGNGDAAQAFQRFALAHAPLTHRAAATESGAEAAITVRVGDVAWAARRTLYGAGAAERVYALESDESGRVWVRFGDGQRGARPVSGVNNLRATYRKGLGAAGNVGADTLTQPAARPLGFKGVSNPLPALGGTDAEPAEDARRSIPLQTRTLGRAVSVLDYEDFARAYAGVAKARAAVLQLPAGPTVCVTVVGERGAALAPGHPTWSNLLAALRASGDPHVPLRLLTHAASTFRLGLKVKVDPAYESAAVLAAVEAALRAHYAFEQRELGQPVQQSEVIAVAHAVPGVVALDLDWLYGGSAPVSQLFKSRQARLLATRMHVKAGLPMAAEVLTLDPAPLERLEVMT